jgi:hypothetical protein
MNREKNMGPISFSHFSGSIERLGKEGISSAELNLGHDGQYGLQYIPFEHVNRDARLVIVGITPGNTQLQLAYTCAQALLRKGFGESDILIEAKKAGAFGGASMKPNLLKMLRHFRFEKLLGIADADMLWGEHAELLNCTSVLPHAAFKDGKPFNGSFQEIMKTPLLRQCFMDYFIGALPLFHPDALFVALGPCPQAALEWCAGEGLIQHRQVLGAFCHPSSAGGNTTAYYLREISRETLDPKDPVRNRCSWLDNAYATMLASISALHAQQHHGCLPASGVPAVTSIDSIPVQRQAVASKRVASSAQAGSAPDDLSDILAEFLRAGYKATKQTMKVAEFQSPNGQTLYLVKTTSNLNSMHLMVHPDCDSERLRNMDGVATVSHTYRFHSNMSGFPKRINNGKTKTAFGWQVSIDSPVGLSRFLSAFDAAGFEHETLC